METFFIGIRLFIISGYTTLKKKIKKRFLTWQKKIYTEQWEVWLTL